MLKKKLLGFKGSKILVIYFKNPKSKILYSLKPLDPGTLSTSGGFAGAKTPCILESFFIFYFLRAKCPYIKA